MTTNRLPISPEALLEHHEWMRALARKLVATPGGADDVVQDVWVTALERPPGSRWPLRAWLAGVLRNIAMQRGREHTRREHREQTVSQAKDAVTPPVIERLANHQDVVQAVLELREPFRTAIVLRYYEGLPPRKIAHREGVTVATVKSRLTRGLTQLRERFAREYGDDGRAWALALAPLIEPPAGAIPGAVEGTSSTLLGVLAAKSPLALGTVAAVVVTVTAAATWLGAGGGQRTPTNDSVVAEPDAAEPDAFGEMSEREGADLVAPNAEAASAIRVAEASQTEAKEHAADEPPDGTGVPDATGQSWALEVQFVKPDRTRLQPKSVRLVLSNGEAEHAVEVANSDTARFEGIQKGEYELTVDARGQYRHITQELDLRSEKRDYDKKKEAFSHRVTLWPEEWVPIIVRTRAGEPFRTVAEQLEYEPKNLFVHAFRAVASVEPIDPEAIDLSALRTKSGHYENDVAKFREPPGYQVTEIGGSVAGSLQLYQPAPLWVGLWVHDVFFENQLLRASDTELVFELGLEDLDKCLAAVQLRLVDRDTGAPVETAEATLKADVSAHRRRDLSKLEPDEEGTIHFRRVIPGRHDLTIRREGHLVHRKLVLGPGQKLDLGDIAIGSGEGIRLVVVDGNGDPARAWVELAPHKQSTSADDLYHPNLHRTTDSKGIYNLPIPDEPSMFRVRHLVQSERRGGQDYRFLRSTPPVSSENFFIDPMNPPREVVVAPRATVGVTLTPTEPWATGDLLALEDGIGIIVEVFDKMSAEQIQVDLLEGTYVVHRWSGGEHIGTQDIRVDANHTEHIAPSAFAPSSFRERR